MEMELKLFGEIYRVTAATMKGRRSENQDCYSLTAASSGTLRGSIMGEGFGPENTDDGDILFAAVCDGLGGWRNGDIASSFIAGGLAGWASSAPRSMDGMMSSLREESRRLDRRLMAEHPHSGTTLSAVIAAEGRWMSVHVGDSRCYRVTGDEVWRTEDQSTVERLFRYGEITEDQMNTHSMSNILDHCFGDDGWKWLVTDDLGNDWDRLVLCSDGAFGYMSVSDFRSLLTSGLTAEEMMNECYERGSTDNITILALDRMRDARAGP